MEQMHHAPAEIKAQASIPSAQTHKYKHKKAAVSFLGFGKAKNLWKRQRFPEFAGKSRYANDTEEPAASFIGAF